jgi:hypothetical protein
LVGQLVRDKVLDPDVAGVLRELAALRNELSHEPDATVTEEAARNYADAAASVVQFFRAARLAETPAWPFARTPAASIGRGPEVAT